VSPRVLRAPTEAAPFREAFARIRTEFNVPAAFPPHVEADAEAVATRGPVVPSGAAATARVDARDVGFVTIDPPGSRDLDQAYQAERRSAGYRVRYAIADVAAFVAPGSALDVESFARGVTLYLPDGRAPLLPNRIGEGCASLLPNEERPALLWTIDLDATGGTVSARLERAIVRSRAALTYGEAQASLDAGRADDSLSLLRTIGALRLERQIERGGVSLDLPTQEVIAAPSGAFALRYGSPLPVEGWNAQISLLAGMEAANIMIAGGVGILRTLPPPQDAQLERLRRAAQALGVAWPNDARWSDVVHALDRGNQGSAAFLIQAAHILRGAGYAKLDATNTDAALVPVHAGLAAPYAHVTAPLRRLADRYANEIVLARCAGEEPPTWVADALDRLVATMEAANRLDADVERAVVDAVECAVLAGHIGERFGAVVIDQNRTGIVVQLSGAAIVAHMDEDLPLGQHIDVIVAAVDPVARHVELGPAAPVPGANKEKAG